MVWVRATMATTEPCLLKTGPPLEPMAKSAVMHIQSNGLAPDSIGRFMYRET